MPEVMPCPECGSTDILTISGHISSFRWWVRCCGCGRQGSCCKTEEDAIAAWNKLPRAIRWTHEPPKVAGWYWWRTSKGQNVNTIQVWSRSGVLGYCFDTEFITALDRGEWAGPIAPPID